MAKNAASTSEKSSIRLDKWLWAARFFKTRSLATDAIKGGRVHVNGARVKPGKAAEIGQIIRINKSPQQFEVEIIKLSDKRGNFSIAQMLYQETEESIARREHEATLRKLANQGVMSNSFKGRPTKRDRRQIAKFTEQTDQ